MKNFNDYVELAQDMTQSTGNRADILEHMDNMYALEDDTLPTSDWIKKTISPDYRNAVIGGARMLSASDPKWSVTLQADAEEAANKLELFADKSWTGAGMINRKPIHFVAALSAMQYGEIHIRAKLVTDLMNSAPDSRKRRLEQVQQRTPVLFDVVNPKLCYVTKDETGLTAHLVKRKMKVSEIKELSKVAETQLASRTINEQLVIYEMYDEEQHVVWIEGYNDPVVMAPLTDGIIPVAYADVEGSELFSLDDNVDSCQPFGYGLYKSGFWDRQNLIHTLGYSLFFAIGSNPLLTGNLDPQQEIVVDYSIPGQVLKAGKDANMHQLFTQTFTGDFKNLLTVADQKATESTLYRTAMGESPGSGAPYSLAALLSANGRQALIPYERMTEHACTMIMTTACLMLKSAGGVYPIHGNKETIELKAEEIPDNVLIEARLEIDLPIDESKNAQMAIQLTSGEHPLASHAHVREKFLGIGQSSEEDKRIIAEKYAWLKAQTTMQAEAQRAIQGIMQQGQSQAAPMAQPQPQPQPMPEQGQLPPEMAAMQGQAMQDQNMGQPIPPDVLAGQGVG